MKKTNKMKFWQYILGTGLAILIFSGAVFSEYSAYQKVSFLEKNPFVLTGEIEYPDKDYKDLISDRGEFIRVFKNSEIEINDKSREIISGKIFLGGSFFDDDSLDRNFIKFGNSTLRYPSSSVMISRDPEVGETEIINYGRTAKIFFLDEEFPFILPSEMGIIMNDTIIDNKSKHDFFYEYGEKFNLSSIDWANPLAEYLKKGVEDVYVTRNSFQEFATKIPNLWEKGNLGFLRSLNLGILNKNNSPNNAKTVLSQIFEIKEMIKNEDEISKNFAKSSLLELKSTLTESLKVKLNSNDEWKLFEKSQKMWLPTINNDRSEWIYRDLWQEKEFGINNLSQILDIAEFFDFNLNAGLIDGQLLEFKKELESGDLEIIDQFKISSLRRRLFYLLKGQMDSGNISIKNLDIYHSVLLKELALYEGSSSRNLIEEEIIRNTLEIIGRNINKKDNYLRNVIKALISSLQESVSLDEFTEENREKLTKNELSTIDNIKLVGISGLTPEEVKIINTIKTAEAELDKRITKEDINVSLENKNIIINSKALWAFLKEQNINININKFRTKHNSLSFETSFENTETDKKKISGLFDYNSQIFKNLSLGTASIRRLQPHSISLWLKEIGGKFEPVEVDKEGNKDSSDVIPQDSREAITNKQFLKNLLLSLNFSVSKTEITVVSKNLKKLQAIDVKFLEQDLISKNLSLSYDLENNEFYDIFFEENEVKIYLSESLISGKTLQEISREKFQKSD